MHTHCTLRASYGSLKKVVEAGWLWSDSTVTAKLVTSVNSHSGAQKH